MLNSSGTAGDGHCGRRHRHRNDPVPAPGARWSGERPLPGRPLRSRVPGRRTTRAAAPRSAAWTLTARTTCSSQSLLMAERGLGRLRLHRVGTDHRGHRPRLGLRVCRGYGGARVPRSQRLDRRRHGRRRLDRSGARRGRTAAWTRALPTRAPCTCSRASRPGIASAPTPRRSRRAKAPPRRPFSAGLTGTGHGRRSRPSARRCTSIIGARRTSSARGPWRGAPPTTPRCASTRPAGRAAAASGPASRP